MENLTDLDTGMREDVTKMQCLAAIILIGVTAEVVACLGVAEQDTIARALKKSVESVDAPEISVGVDIVAMCMEVDEAIEVSKGPIG